MATFAFDSSTRILDTVERNEIADITTEVTEKTSDRRNLIHSGSEQNQILDRLNQNFKIELATTPEMLRQAYSIRYEVYCRELGFEALSPEDGDGSMSLSTEKNENGSKLNS